MDLVSEFNTELDDLPKSISFESPCDSLRRFELLPCHHDVAVYGYVFDLDDYGLSLDADRTLVDPGDVRDERLSFPEILRLIYKVYDATVIFVVHFGFEVSQLCIINSFFKSFDFEVAFGIYADGVLTAHEIGICRAHAGVDG